MNFLNAQKHEIFHLASFHGNYSQLSQVSTYIQTYCKTNACMNLTSIFNLQEFKNSNNFIKKLHQTQLNLRPYVKLIQTLPKIDFFLSVDGMKSVCQKLKLSIIYWVL